MVKYSIGYNHDPNLLELVSIFKEHVDSVYFPAPASIIGSGRALEQEKGYENIIMDIISRCKEAGVSSQLLLNPTCEGQMTGKKEHLARISAYVKKLEEAGLGSVVVTNPINMAELRKELPGLEIHASVNCYVKDAESAMFLKEAGADVITVDRDINRDLELIKEIKGQTGLKIKVLVNEGCLRNCPFRKVHFNMISHMTDSEDFDRRSCITVLEKHPEKVFSIPFIRPEDIRHYIGIADQFKLATRSMHTAKIAMVLQSYVEQRHEGDLLFLLSTKALFQVFNSIDNEVLTKENFFENMQKCAGGCTGCGYCKGLLEKAAAINPRFRQQER